MLFQSFFVMCENATDKFAHLYKLEFQFISPHSVGTRMAHFSPLALSAFVSDKSQQAQPP